jgi:hypothetical protein
MIEAFSSGSSTMRRGLRGAGPEGSHAPLALGCRCRAVESQSAQPRLGEQRAVRPYAAVPMPSPNACGAQPPDGHRAPRMCAAQVGLACDVGGAPLAPGRSGSTDRHPDSSIDRRTSTWPDHRSTRAQSSLRTRRTGNRCTPSRDIRPLLPGRIRRCQEAQRSCRPCTPTDATCLSG